MQSQHPDALQLYMDYVLYNTISPLISSIISELPRTFNEACEIVQRKARAIQNPPDWETKKEHLGRILQKIAIKNGLFTPKAKKNLDHFYTNNNIIEVSHQPKFMGGERFVLNKLACGGIFSNQIASSVPIFYIADYDQIHRELTKTRFPIINSATGFSIGIDKDIEDCYGKECVECLPLPSESSLTQKLQQIREKYEFSINSCNITKDKKNLLHERVNNSLLLLKRNYLQSNTYTEWFMKILGEIGNIINNYGYLFLPASDPDFKKLQLPYYEELLSQTPQYIQIYNTQFDRLEMRGINPPLRKLRPDFVPMFYHCPNEECHQNRISLFWKQHAQRLQIYGICNQCHEHIEFEISPNHPDLTDHILQLSPRVDSRQFLVSRVLSPTLHISGTGETRYSMQTLPLLKKFAPELPLPGIYFYNKTTMNTFITRELEQQLIKSNLSLFLQKLKKIMAPLPKINSILNNSKSRDILPISTQQLTTHMLTQADAIMEMKQYLEASVNETSKVLERNLIQSYLGNIMGQISAERSGQEAVFHWMEAAIQHGLPNLMMEYQKLYCPGLRPGLQFLN